jgi:predicted esterase YcpF (UPF0227 family)
LNKTVLVYHGLGGSPASDRIDLLESLGYKVIYPHIEFEKEWDLDKCKSLFQRELNNAEKSDIIIGFSLGGYLAYLLANASGKNLVLINPALNREKSALNIKNFDIDQYPNNLGEVEIFFGANDIVVPMNDQVNFLKSNNINSSNHIISNMEHRTPINKFQEIINISKFL